MTVGGWGELVDRLSRYLDELERHLDGGGWDPSPEAPVLPVEAPGSPTAGELAALAQLNRRRQEVLARVAHERRGVGQELRELGSRRDAARTYLLH